LNQYADEFDYPWERLTDLSNAEAKRLLKACYECLSECESDEDMEQIPERMNINPELFQDLLELMVLKGWLERTTESD